MSYKSIIPTTIAVLGMLLSPINAAKANDGTYVSVWGGYFYTDAPEVEGFSQFFGASQFQEFPLDAEYGSFFGVSFSTAIDPTSLIFKHIEIYFEGQITEKDKQAISVPSGTIVTGFSIPDGRLILLNSSDTSAELERERYEFGANLSLSDQMPNLGPLNLVATIFGGFANENFSVTQIGPTFSDASKSDLDWQFFGLLLGTDATVPVTAGLDLILRGAAGFYHFDADADFVSTSTTLSFNQQTSDSDNDFGFRGKLSAELRAKLTEGMTVSLFGGIDYWSDIPYAKLPDSTPPFNVVRVPSHIDTDDVVDFKAGIKVTVSLDGQQ